MVDYVATQRIRARARARARDVSLLRSLDWMLFAAVAGLVAYGLWAIAGITQHDVEGDPNYYVARQGAYVLLGTVGLVAAILVDPGLYSRHKRVVYGAMLALLIVVPVFGEEVRNTRRWIDLGPFRFQPSEFGKLLVILFLAAFLAERGKRIAEGRTVLAASWRVAITDSCTRSSSCSPTWGRPSSTPPPSRRAFSWRASAGLISRRSPSRRCSSWRPSSGSPPPRGSTCWRTTSAPG